MHRGFTLLEMLITIALLSVVLTFSVPSFKSLTENHQINSLADELQGFMLQAKSEAVFRNQDLWAHLVMDSNPSSTGKWKILLKDSDDVSAGTTLLQLNGQAFRNIWIYSEFSSDQVKFDGVRGKVKNGSLYFYSASDSRKKLKLSTSFGASRIIICGQQGAYYGYPQCK